LPGRRFVNTFSGSVLVELSTNEKLESPVPVAVKPKEVSLTCSACFIMVIELALAFLIIQDFSSPFAT